MTEEKSWIQRNIWLIVGMLIGLYGLYLFGVSDSNEEQRRLTLETHEQQWRGRSAYITGTVNNPTLINFGSVWIEFDLYDTDGNKLGMTSAQVSGLDAGETWRFEAPIPYDKATRYKLTELNGF